MRFLLIDTCTERGVIAFGNHKDILFATELPFGSSQSKFLMPYLVESLKPFGDPPLLDAVAVGMGPGSYTGIRLGVAVAQALAYSWKVPVIGVSSLEGFIPSISLTHYAAVFDARIGGVYFQTGSIVQGAVHRSHPQVAPIKEIGEILKEIPHLVTPFAKSLQTKLKQQYPSSNWVWEERYPSSQALLQSAEERHIQEKWVIPPRHLELLYLRQTEAEREKELKRKL